jgi:hypothetical protein
LKPQFGRKFALDTISNMSICLLHDILYDGIVLMWQRADIMSDVEEEKSSSEYLTKRGEGE